MDTQKKISTFSDFTVSDIECKAKMDQNESPFDLNKEIKEKICADMVSEKWNNYPQPIMYKEIKAGFSKEIGVPDENLFLTVGGDQVIAGAFLLSHQLFGKENKAVLFEPTYPMYNHFVKTLNIPHERIFLGKEYLLNKRLFLSSYHSNSHHLSEQSYRKPGV